MIEYIVSTQANFLAMAEIALVNELYVNDGKHTLGHDYKYYLDVIPHQVVKAKYTWVKYKTEHSRPRYIITLAKIEDKYIGALVIDHNCYSVFVKEEYRRQGIASNMFIATSKLYDLTYKVSNNDWEKPAVVALNAKFKLSTSYSDLNKPTVFTLPTL